MQKSWKKKKKQPTKTQTVQGDQLDRGAVF